MANSAGGGLTMDIHKPKPWHGLREFLKEYLIIVIGVLTALGAEAVVERLHERQMSAEAREAVRAEVRLDLANVDRRLAAQTCINDRIREIEGLLDAAEHGRSFQAATLVSVVSTPQAYTERWEAATAGGRTSLFSSDEQRDLARIYHQFGFMNERKAEEEDAWARLGALEGREQLSPEMLARAREALAQAKMLNRRQWTFIYNATQYAGMIGLKADPHLLADFSARVGGKPAFCLPITATHADAQRINADPPGLP
jgi:hypothetical protein